MMAERLGRRMEAVQSPDDLVDLVESLKDLLEAIPDDQGGAGTASSAHGRGR